MANEKLNVILSHGANFTYLSRRWLGLYEINHPSYEEAGRNGGKLPSNAGACVHDEIRILGDGGVRIVARVILAVSEVCGVRRHRHCDVDGLPLAGVDGYSSVQADCSHSGGADADVCKGNIRKGNQANSIRSTNDKNKLTCQRRVRSRNGPRILPAILVQLLTLVSKPK